MMHKPTHSYNVDSGADVYGGLEKIFATYAKIVRLITKMQKNG